MTICAMLRPQARNSRVVAASVLPFSRLSAGPRSIDARTSRRSKSDFPSPKMAQACSSRAKSSVVKSAWTRCLAMSSLRGRGTAILNGEGTGASASFIFYTILNKPVSCQTRKQPQRPLFRTLSAFYRIFTLCNAVPLSPVIASLYNLAYRSNVRVRSRNVCAGVSRMHHDNASMRLVNVRA